MKTILYLSSKSETADRLEDSIHMALPNGDMETYHTLESLSHRLRQPLLGRSLLVLLAESEKELDAMVELAGLLDSFIIILVLPNSDRLTISKAHTLKPRFFAIMNEDFKDVVLVVKNIIYQNSDIH